MNKKDETLVLMVVLQRPSKGARFTADMSKSMMDSLSGLTQKITDFYNYREED